MARLLRVDPGASPARAAPLQAFEHRRQRDTTLHGVLRMPYTENNRWPSGWWNRFENAWGKAFGT